MITIAFQKNIHKLDDEELCKVCFKNYKSINDVTSLHNYNDITMLSCSNLKLTQLPELPDCLESLYCFKNNLKFLPKLPSQLIILWCQDNLIETLPELPDKLDTLWCGRNKITEIYEIPVSLKVLKCAGNLITDLPNSDYSNMDINIYNTPLKKIIDDNYDGNLHSYLQSKY